MRPGTRYGRPFGSIRLLARTARAWMRQSPCVDFELVQQPSARVAAAQLARVRAFRCRSQQRHRKARERPDSVPARASALACAGLAARAKGRAGRWSRPGWDAWASARGQASARRSAAGRSLPSPSSRVPRFTVGMRMRSPRSATHAFPSALQSMLPPPSLVLTLTGAA